MRAAPAYADHAEQGAVAASTAVTVYFAGDRWSPELEREVLDHLRAGLDAVGLAVCRPEDAARPVAEIELSLNGTDRVSVTISIRDGITDKRLARDLDLRDIPDDGRALGISVAADELLRASWVELAVTGAPQPRRSLPRAVRRTVEQSLRRPSIEVAGRASFEHYEGGLTHVGGDASLRHWLHPRIAVHVHAGLRGGLPEASHHGEIGASAVGGGIGMALQVVRASPWRVDLEAGVWSAQVRFWGRPSSSAHGRQGADVVVYGRTGAVASLWTNEKLGLVVRTGIGVPFRAVSARDHGQVATAASGLELYAAVGPAVVF